MMARPACCACRAPPAGWSPGETVLHALAEATMRQLHSYIPQNLSNTVSRSSTHWQLPGSTWHNTSGRCS